MDLTTTIKRMAHLARLKFPETELVRYTQKVEAILSYIEKLNELDTSKVEPTSHAVEVDTRDVQATLRPDVVRQFERPEEIIADAPEKDGLYVQVPRVIE